VIDRAEDEARDADGELEAADVTAVLVVHGLDQDLAEQLGQVGAVEAAGVAAEAAAGGGAAFAAVGGLAFGVSGVVEEAEVTLRQWAGAAGFAVGAGGGAAGGRHGRCLRAGRRAPLG
jgi:hypothetical protein